MFQKPLELFYGRSLEKYGDENTEYLEFCKTGFTDFNQSSEGQNANTNVHSKSL